MAEAALLFRSGRAAILTAFLFALAGAGAAHAAGPVDPCGPGETVWFAAKLEKDKGLVSLCGTASSDGKPLWLQFRLRRPDAAELRYPADRANSLKAFTYRRYTRPRTTYLKLDFADDDFSYAILEWFEADFTPSSSAQLRIVRRSGGATVSDWALQMLTPPLNIMKLEDSLPNAPFDE